ncbi:predicted protein [Sclerotinia sclerotiorum 1980 UF-70]|uniref:Uncharacterized protein n=2 Tax=Sclerotinia sclerotiorum (strain ATCC 18683 / 1980 / Ss-1) TaxID=665079 RepID=A7E9I8_SCLS1|nr:predicted protein [Sclerotinia sclerotiorum 1980 UF-70]APA05698.1 hypothetical protein sscle_01g004680 [Sclerotinia sclerotiorum 1980 UF-70]EDN97040.1 predicted protein [Sclerotinia sclerotiorum 1980 UF-70]
MRRRVVENIESNCESVSMDIAGPAFYKINTDDIKKPDVMQIDEPAAGEKDPKKRPVKDEVHQRREKHRPKRQETMREKVQHTSNLERLSIKGQPNQIARLQEENFSALRRQIEQAKVILDNIPLKECIQETEVETALLIYKLYCHMEKEIIALHSTPRLLSYGVMVEKIVRIKQILKDNYGMDELENEGYVQENTVHFTYKATLNIEKRTRFLSALPIAKTDAAKRLINHGLHPRKFCDLCSKINITHITLNHNSEYEMLLHQERFVQAAAINHTWEKRETNNENTTPDFKGCRVRAQRSLRDSGKEFFEMFEDVIDTKPLYDGSSKRGMKYGENCMAYLCYVEAKQANVEEKRACWKACRTHRAFSEWKDIDMEVRDLSGLGNLRREISAIRMVLIRSLNNSEQSKKIKNKC